MFDGMFIVGIETPDGQATYHYDIDPYWNMFECKELENAPVWDGHTPTQAIERIGKLEPARHGRWIRVHWHSDDSYVDGGWWIYRCNTCDIPHNKESRFCPNCGAKMGGGKEE